MINEKIARKFSPQFLPVFHPMTLDQRLRSMRNTMRDMFGISRLRAGQEDIMRSVLKRHDTLATMPTGAGKSQCYQLPALHLDGMTVVVSPLIALMKDQTDKLRAAGIDCTLVNSTLRSRAEREALMRIAAGESGIVFVTPERLAQPPFIDIMSSHAERRVGLMVVDEAHCVSQWGHDFQSASLKIASAVKAPGHPPVLALTATATATVLDDIVRALGLKGAALATLKHALADVRWQAGGCAEHAGGRAHCRT